MKNLKEKQKNILLALLLTDVYFIVISIVWISLELFIFGKTFPSSMDTLIAILFAVILTKLTFHKVKEDMKNV